MSKDLSPENYFLAPVALTSIKLYPQSSKGFEARASLAKIYKNLDIKPPLIPEKPNKEELPEILQQLHSFEPLCRSATQRQLARKALDALKNRQPEDIRNLAKSLADDVADAID